MTPAAQEEKIARMHLTLWAYAYEIESSPMASDADYDELSKSINLDQETDDSDLDDFFRDHFTPDSGMWIHKHPRLGRIKAIFNSIRGAI